MIIYLVYLKGLYDDECLTVHPGFQAQPIGCAPVVAAINSQILYWCTENIAVEEA